MIKMNIPNHIAIILDGNGRWAKKRGLPRNLGHYNGATNLFKIANKAHGIGVKYLTVFAFSTENWSRPKEEVNYLMEKPLEYLEKNRHRLHEIKYKIKVLGRKDRIPNSTLKAIKELEESTKDNKGMVLQIALDYGAKDELINAFSKAKSFEEEEVRKHFYIKQDVDLLIRTSGEKRLSNFLLWQSAYAEFVFVKKHWPSFKEKDLIKAIKEFNKRNRRFGGLK